MSSFITAILKNIDYTIPIFCIKAMAFIIGFFFVATLFAGFLSTLYHFIFAQKFGYRIKFFSLFGLVFIKKDNRWKKIFNNLAPVCFAMNLPKFDEVNFQQDYLKKEKQLIFSQRFTNLFISIVIFVLTLGYIIAFFKGESISLIGLFLIGFSTGMVFHSVNHIGISFYIYNKLFKGLLGYIQSKRDSLLEGEKIEKLDLKPIEELPYNSPSEMEKLYYYLIYCSYLLSLNKFEELQKVSHEMTDMLWKKSLNLFYFASYYWLIFYYSEIEKDKEMADDFFRIIEPVVCNDEESNAKRVLAYYYYRVYNDSEKAKTLIEEGLSGIDKYSFGEERVFEKELLLKLKNEIDSKPVTTVS